MSIRIQSQTQRNFSSSRLTKLKLRHVCAVRREFQAAPLPGTLRDRRARVRSLPPAPLLVRSHPAQRHAAIPPPRLRRELAPRAAVPRFGARPTRPARVPLASLRAWPGLRPAQSLRPSPRRSAALAALPVLSRARAARSWTRFARQHCPCWLLIASSSSARAGRDTPAPRRALRELPLLPKNSAHFGKANAR